MENIIRSAKSGSDWTENELVAFNIEVRRVDTETFFGQAVLPLTHDGLSQVSPIILNNIDAPADCTKTERNFFGLLRDDAILAEESHVDDFAAFLLDLLDYNAGGRLIHSHKEIGFVMCGQRVLAKPDVCLVDHSGRGGCLLLVQGDKRATSNSDPEPQLIAEAIAAFSEMRLAMRLTGQPVDVPHLSPMQYTIAMTILTSSINTSFRPLSRSTACLMCC